MVTKDESLKLALEALDWENCNDVDVLDKAQKIALAAIKEALAQPAQEPVAMRYDYDGYGYKYIDNGSGSDWQTRIKDAEPLYATPPAQPTQDTTCAAVLPNGKTARNVYEAYEIGLSQRAQPAQESNQSPSPEYDRGFSEGWNRCKTQTQPAQEPVSWIEHHKAGDNLVWDKPNKGTPLYTTPPAAQSAQEPVAYDKTEMNIFVQDLYDRKMQEAKHGHYETMFHCVHQAIKRLYTTPPQRPWVGLTDEEVDQFHNWKDCTWSTNELVRYVEATLRSKNT